MDLSKIKDLKDLQSLFELMGSYDLAELELESEGRKIRARKKEPPVVTREIAPPMVAATPTVAAAGGVPVAPAELPAAEAAPVDKGHEVVSPLVGSFYRAPSPEADPFVKEGDRVEADSVLCIIEAMKVMNEIRAGIVGIVQEVLVKNGESVEFGQPLFRLQPE